MAVAASARVQWGSATGAATASDPAVAPAGAEPSAARVRMPTGRAPSSVTTTTSPSAGPWAPRSATAVPAGTGRPGLTISAIDRVGGRPTRVARSTRWYAVTDERPARMSAVTAAR